MGKQSKQNWNWRRLQQRQQYTVDFKLRAIREVVERGAPCSLVARTLGISPTTLSMWVTAFRSGGPDALVGRRRGPKQKPPTREREAKRQAVETMRREHPEFGTRRIRDLLARFQAIGVSETEVRRILHEAGLIEQQPVGQEREHPERRFERAEPNQLWQSDIFTFLLRRHERLYLAGFMDDHSRFIVSYALAHHQKSELVMDALRRGIENYGTPREILTDQGRQYTAWRGTTEFEEELRREGIKHVKSRPQHPQTLGKIERFWKTLWDEFCRRPSSPTTPIACVA